MSANVGLVRAICECVERGELSVATLASLEIEWVIADGPEPGIYLGVVHMEQGLSTALDAWTESRAG